MACTLDAEIGGIDSNSYATIEEADTYHATILYSDAWDTATDDAKCRALVSATRMLDTWFDWVGTVASSEQRLLWPRDGAYGPNGYLHTTDEIPELIIWATAEQARALLLSDRSADSEVETQGLKSLTAGSVQLEFSENVKAKPIPDAVMSMASFYARPRTVSGSGTVHMYRA